MARIGKTGNAKIAQKALARLRKVKSGKQACKLAVKAFAEAAAHTGAAVHGGEKAKGLHKQLHAAEKKVTSLCAEVHVKIVRRKKSSSRRRRSSADDFDLGDYFGGGRGGGGSSSSARSSSSRSTMPGAPWAASSRPGFYAPASGSGGAAFTREQFNRATGFSGLRRRKRK